MLISEMQDLAANVQCEYWGGGGILYVVSQIYLIGKLFLFNDCTRYQFGKSLFRVLANYIFVSVLLYKFCIILMQLKLIIEKGVLLALKFLSLTCLI